MTKTIVGGFAMALLFAAGCRVNKPASGVGDRGEPWLSPPANLAPALAVPQGSVLKIHDRGRGAQVYTCTAGGAAGGVTTYAWVLKAPDAKLYDATEVQVGTHGAGPNWTSTVDASVVKGAKVAQVDAPLGGAIPWLLLRASSTAGTGVFSDIIYIQRANTVGGKAPTTGCESTTVRTEIRVDYAADYYFYAGGQ